MRGDNPAAENLLRACMDQLRMTARAEGIARDADGRLRVDDLRRVLADSVVVEVHLR